MILKLSIGQARSVPFKVADDMFVLNHEMTRLFFRIWHMDARRIASDRSDRNQKLHAPCIQSESGVRLKRPALRLQVRSQRHRDQ